MFATLMDRLGDRNPQLLREIKGRLRWRSIIIAVGLSLLAQLLMLLTFLGQLPGPFHQSHLRAVTIPELSFRLDYPADGSSPIPERLFVEQVYGNVSQSPIIAGDHITAIDGRSIADFGGNWNTVDAAVNGRLASDFEQPSSGHEYIDPQIKTQSLDEIENTPVDLEVERNGATFNVQLSRTASPNLYNTYCLEQPVDSANAYRSYHGNCTLQANSKYYLVDWQQWYGDFFRVVSIVMAVGLLSAGSFLLIQNIDREQRRGTLTFIRLSPRSAFTVLGGQIMGAPIAVYLAIALCVPLHLGIGILGRFNLLELATFYGFLGINCGFFFSLSLLYGLLSQGLGGFQAWLFSGGLLGIQLILGIPLSLDDLGNRDIHHWLTLFSPMAALHYILGVNPELNSNDALSFAGKSLPFILFSALFIANGLVWTLWAWHGLRRKFINPNAPLVNRPLSYLLTVCFEVFLLGFAANSSDTDFVLTAIAFTNLLYFGLLIAALQPTSQAMADWARFRHTQPKRQRSNRIQDWLLSNQSPPILALAANLGIGFTLIATWVSLADIISPVEMMMGFAACMTLILVYGAINQLIFISRIRRPSLWSAVTLVLLVVIPLFSLAVLYSTAYIGLTTQLTLFAAPWLVAEEAAISLRLFALLGQWTATLICTGIAAGRLKQIGASESKAMLTGAGRLPNGI